MELRQLGECPGRLVEVAAVDLVALHGGRHVLQQQREPACVDLDVAGVAARRADLQPVGKVEVEADLDLVDAQSQPGRPAGLIGRRDLEDRRPAVVGRDAEGVAHRAGA